MNGNTSTSINNTSKYAIKDIKNAADFSKSELIYLELIEYYNKNLDIIKKTLSDKSKIKEFNFDEDVILAKPLILGKITDNLRMSDNASTLTFLGEEPKFNAHKINDASTLLGNEPKSTKIYFLTQCEKDLLRQVYYCPDKHNNRPFNITTTNKNISIDKLLKLFNEEILESKDNLSNYDFTKYYDKKFNYISDLQFETDNDNIKKLLFNMRLIHQNTAFNISGLLGKINTKSKIFKSDSFDKKYNEIYNENALLAPNNTTIIYIDKSNKICARIGLINYMEPTKDIIISIAKFILFNTLDNFNEKDSFLLFTSNINNCNYNEYYQKIANMSYHINVSRCLSNVPSTKRFDKSFFTGLSNRTVDCGASPDLTITTQKYKSVKTQNICDYGGLIKFRDYKTTKKNCKDLTPVEKLNSIYELYNEDYGNIPTSIFLIADYDIIMSLLIYDKIQEQAFQNNDLIEIQYDKNTDNFNIKLYRKENETISTLKINYKLNEDKLPKYNYHKIYLFYGIKPYTLKFSKKTNQFTSNNINDTLSVNQVNELFSLLPKLLKVAVLNSLPIIFTSHLFEHQLISSLIYCYIMNSPINITDDIIKKDNTQNQNNTYLLQILLNLLIIKDINNLNSDLHLFNNFVENIKKLRIDIFTSESINTLVNKLLENYKTYSLEIGKLPTKPFYDQHFRFLSELSSKTVNFNIIKITNGYIYKQNNNEHTDNNTSIGNNLLVSNNDNNDWRVVSKKNPSHITSHATSATSWEEPAIMVGGVNNKHTKHKKNNYKKSLKKNISFINVKYSKIKIKNKYKYNKKTYSRKPKNQ